MEKVSITEKFRSFDKYWQSKIVAEFNGQTVRVVKMKGTFEWHSHKTEDELLIAIKGHLTIQFRDKEEQLKEGDLFVIPKSTEHRLRSDDEASLLAIEPKSTTQISEVAKGV